MRISAALIALAALLPFAGCGEESDADHSGSRDVPVCEDVVVEGAPITEALFESGCEMPNGNRFLFSAFECADGDRFITYDDRFYGRVGDVWHANRGEPADDPAYSLFLKVC